MPDKNSPWGPKGGSGGGKKNPWGNTGKPDRGRPGANDTSPDLENVIEGFKNRVRSGGGGGGRNGGGKGNDLFGKLGPFGIVLIGAAIFLITSMIYTVDQAERAIVLRFGEYARTEGPGLKFKLPAPIETKVIRETEVIQKDTIGGNDRASLMLTGDENIVDIDFTILWRITDYKDYYFEVDEPRVAVRAVAESAMREIIGKNKLEEIITTERLAVTTAVRDLTQRTLDEYQAGVRIVEVQLQKADAPDQGGVVDAFRDVVDAEQDAETTVNEATRYQNDVVPRARGDAAKILQDAEGYRDSVIAEAKGEAERFNLIYEEYKAAPRVTRQRMYLETIEEVYKDADKIVLGSEAGSGVVPYLPLDQLTKKKAGQ